MQDAKVVRFEGFEVHPAQRLLVVEGRPCALGSRAFDLLLALIARPGRLVAKAELVEAIWPAAAVGENNLAVQVGNLRKALGAAIVATVPGRGYRLTAKPLDDATAAAAQDDLIGRTDEVRALHALLDAFRLVTLVGAGGVGKTRLARHVAAGRAGRHPDGAFVVDLTTLAHPALLADAIAARLGLADAHAGAGLDRLLLALAPLQMLLVLDGAEHLADAVATLVARLLGAAPGVRVLVTSLAPLQLLEEQVERLDGLALPDGHVDAAQAAHHAAVALFVARARADDPAYVLDDADVDAVLELCRGLDGLPLAIEMAAARLPALGVHGLRAVLEDPLQLGHADSTATPAHHRTLRATLERSHDLLASAERSALRRLGVLQGGFTLELGSRLAAAGPDECARWQALDALGVLVERSLVIADADDPPRYRLSAPARAFALERLAASGELAEVRTLHARLIRQYLEGVSPGRLADVAETRRRLSAEAANAHAALAWATDHDGETAAALAALLALAPGRDAPPPQRAA